VHRRGIESKRADRTAAPARRQAPHAPPPAK
jgi:hypothetical protein